MLTGQWQLGWAAAAAAAIAVHALVAYRAYRLAGRREAVATAGAPSDDVVVDPEAGVVECPDCGTDNEFGYRFCRACVGELPRAMDFSRAADDPLGRLTR